MMELDVPAFTSKDDEIQYWMDVAQQMYQRKEDVEHELEEFQESSQMLEKELETSLEQAEKTNRELRQRNSRLATEIEQLRSRLDQQTADCSVFQARASELEGQHEQLIKYIRELEQKNDDLERAQRINMASEEAIEAKFNSAIEKNALLESELDEKESLKILVQRLMDENRDLKQEIKHVKRHLPDNDKSADKVRALMDSNKLQVELETNTPPVITPLTTQGTATHHPTSPALKLGNGVVMNNNNNMNMPMAPSSRIQAMNLIGDLMRRVGLDRWVCLDCRKVKCSCPPGKKTDPKESSPAMENKLNTCRNASREDQAMRDLYRTTTIRRQVRSLASGNNNHI